MVQIRCLNLRHSNHAFDFSWERRRRVNSVSEVGQNHAKPPRPLWSIAFICVLLKGRLIIKRDGRNICSSQKTPVVEVSTIQLLWAEMGTFDIYILKRTKGFDYRGLR